MQVHTQVVGMNKTSTHLFPWCFLSFFVFLAFVSLLRSMVEMRTVSMFVTPIFLHLIRASMAFFRNHPHSPLLELLLTLPLHTEKYTLYCITIRLCNVYLLSPTYVYIYNIKWYHLNLQTLVVN